MGTVLKLKSKIYIIQTFIAFFFVIVFFSTYNSYISQKKDDLKENINTLVQGNKLFVEQYLKLMYKDHQTNQKRYQKIHLQTQKEYLKNPKISLDKLKQNIKNELDIKDFDIDIYIIDKNYTIKNTTYKRDLGFNLGTIEDAKMYLDKTKKDSKIHVAANISVDILDANLNIYSYSKIDSETFLELGFKLKSSLYKDLKTNLEKVQDSIGTKTLIYRVTQTADGKEIYNNLFKDKSEIYQRKSDFEKILKKFDKDRATDDKHINAIRFNKVLSEIIENKYIAYVPLLSKDENELLFYNTLLMKIEIDINKYLKSLEIIRNNFYSFGFILIAFMAILYYLIRFNFYKPMENLTKIFEEEKKVEDRKLLEKKDEFGVLIEKYNKLYDSLNRQIDLNTKLLEENKRFIADTVHQIRTPLTNIMMNGEMVRKFKKDDDLAFFIDQIDASINMLSNSYEDLAYVTSFDTIEYKARKLNISELLTKRVKFFSTISKVNYKSIVLKIEDKYDVFINEVECERLIDNNISNAIKYAHVNKDIEIILYVKDKKLHLEFKSFGDEIKDKNRVFEKNYRENEAKRGLGLGLNMVKNICEKNGISYEVSYVQKQNIFKYTFGISS